MAGHPLGPKRRPWVGNGVQIWPRADKREDLHDALHDRRRPAPDRCRRPPSSRPVSAKPVRVNPSAPVQTYHAGKKTPSTAARWQLSRSASREPSGRRAGKGRNRVSPQVAPTTGRAQPADRMRGLVQLRQETRSRRRRAAAVSQESLGGARLSRPARVRRSAQRHHAAMGTCLKGCGPAEVWPRRSWSGWCGGQAHGQSRKIPWISRARSDPGVSTRSRSCNWRRRLASK